MAEPALGPTPQAGAGVDVGEEPVRLLDGSEVRGQWLLPGSWRPLPSGRCQLVATRCLRCGELTFPAAEICPQCWGTTLHTELVEGRGMVYALTTVRVSEPGIEAPYRIGYADFAGGLRICGRFTGPNADIGDPVDTVTVVLRQQPHGPLLGWAFRKSGV